MRNIHHAIRPAIKDGEYFLYVVEYSGEDLITDILSATIHIVDKDGMIGPNQLPEYMMNTPATKLAMLNLLMVDGIQDNIPIKDTNN